MRIEEAIEILRTAVGCCSNDIEYVALETLVSALKRKPIKHGYWITRCYEYEDDWVTTTIRDELCSCCRQSSDEQFDYCPNCGARMEE